MRVVIDGRYLGSRPSGIGNYIRALVARLPALAPELEFRVWTGPDGQEQLSNDRLQCHPVTCKANGLMTLVGPWLLDRLTPEDLFHAPANILGFGLPCQSIVTLHDTMWLDRPEDCQPKPWLRPISRRYFQSGIRNALRKASRVLTVSHASARAIERINGAVGGKIRVIHNGFEPHFVPAGERSAVRAKAAKILGFDEEYLLVVGQNQPSKGHEVALRAFAAANTGRLRLVFVQRLAAGRSLAHWVREQRLGDQVRFVAHLELKAFLAVLQSAKALLQPSYDEGFGLPALEAAACGCSVVASDIEALREVLGDAATYAEKGSIEAWTQAIEQLSVSDETDFSCRKKLQERARAFSWDQTARATLGVYREVIAARSGPA